MMALSVSISGSENVSLHQNCPEGQLKHGCGGLTLRVSDSYAKRLSEARVAGGTPASGVLPHTHLVNRRGVLAKPAPCQRELFCLSCHSKETVLWFLTCFFSDGPLTSHWDPGSHDELNQPLILLLMMTMINSLLFLLN